MYYTSSTSIFFFFNDTATTEIYTLSLHDALPIYHFDALRLGLEGAVAQQRIEPDQAAAGSVQPVHLERQPVVGLALQPVGDQEYNGALAQHPPAPQFVEGMQRGGDAGAAGPILHRGRTARQRLVGI